MYNPDRDQFHINEPEPKHVRRARIRLMIAAGMFALIFAVLAGRLVQLTLAPRDAASQSGKAGAAQTAWRRDITDRHGQILATDLKTSSLFADARYVWDAQEITAKVLQIFPDLDASQVHARLASRQAFVWIKRQITPAQREAVYRLGFPALGFRDEPRRVYPLGALAAHVLGYVSVDNQGQAGLERGLNDRLLDPQRTAEGLALSIDARAQYAVEAELQAAIQTFGALGAAGVVMDVHTGEILALASLPDFDPNSPPAPDDEVLFNRAAQGVYEMGSTFKTFTTAMVLDSGKAGLNTLFDARAPLAVGRFRISDFHPQARKLTTAEVFEHSSNIGSARMAMLVGIDGHREFLGKLGLLNRVAFELPEAGAPQAPRRWSHLHSLTISYGHGVAVNAVQLSAAAAAMVNGGRLHRPSVLRKPAGQTVDGEQVISERTSAQIRDLLRAVVTKGTGKQAEVAGYPVGGKTGTAEKPRNGGYAESALLTSFLANFPAHKPRYSVLVILDEPKPTKNTHGYATAGWNAAPTAGKIIARLGPVLNVEVTTAEAGGGSQTDNIKRH